MVYVPSSVRMFFVVVVVDDIPGPKSRNIWDGSTRSIVVILELLAMEVEIVFNNASLPRLPFKVIGKASTRKASCNFWRVVGCSTHGGDIRAGCRE